MFLGALTLEIWIHDAESLKARRMVVNSLLDRIRARFNVSAAQLDQEDLWQRATLGVAVISNDRTVAEKVLNHVRDLIDNDSRCDLCRCGLEIL